MPSTAPDRPLVTVYIPTHNRAEMCVRAVRSALAQSVQDLEVIVVDDGSQDDTCDKLRAVQRMDRRLKILRLRSPQGACAARNRALAEARGRYCTGLDDDDEFTPEHVAGLMEAFDLRWAMVAPSLLEVGPKGAVPYVAEAGRIGLSDLLHYNRVGPQVLTTTERLRAVGGFDERFPALQDYDLWVRLVAAYGPCLRLAEPTYILHTEHGGPRISASPERRLSALDRFGEKHAAKMSAAHCRSMELHRVKYCGQRLSIGRALNLLSPGNAKMVASLLINDRLPIVQKAYHLWQTIRAGRSS